MDEPMYGTPIEARLAADHSGALRKRLKKELGALMRDIEKELCRPQTPQQYRRLRLMRDVCAAGMRTLDVLAKRLRKRA